MHAGIIKNRALSRRAGCVVALQSSCGRRAATARRIISIPMSSPISTPADRGWQSRINEALRKAAGLVDQGKAKSRAVTSAVAGGRRVVAPDQSQPTAAAAGEPDHASRPCRLFQGLSIISRIDELRLLNLQDICSKISPIGCNRQSRPYRLRSTIVMSGGPHRTPHPPGAYNPKTAIFGRACLHGRCGIRDRREAPESKYERPTGRRTSVST